MPVLKGPVVKVPLAPVTRHIKIPLHKGPCSYREFGEHLVEFRQLSRYHNKKLRDTQVELHILSKPRCIPLQSPQFCFLA